jgi:hypothetical protein
LATPSIHGCAPGTGVTGGSVQDLDHLVESRGKALAADPKPDPAPQARRLELLGQAGDVVQALALVAGEDLERRKAGSLGGGHRLAPSRRAGR